MHEVDVETFLRESIEAVWDRKMLGRIADLYAPHALIHIGAGEVLHGGQQLLERAVHWLAAFPDLRVFIDDVLCARRGASDLTSVRWTAVGRNTGPSVLGAPTGRRVVVEGIAASRIERGRYAEQWIELGDGDLVRQLDLDAATALRCLWPEDATPDVDKDLGLGAMESRADDPRRVRPPEPGYDAPADAGALVAASADAIWNRRQIGEVARFYAPHYRERRTDGRVLFGCDELQADTIALMGTLPDLRIHVDDVFWDDDPLGGCRSSTRWTLLGSNTGPSAYGPPTGAGLRLSGITNHRIRDGRFVEGWTAYSELGLARRLIRAAPRAPNDETEQATREAAR